MKTRTLTLLVAFIATTPIWADDFSSLEERMTGKEFRETGLHKLTDAELESLNAWVKKHQLLPEHTPPAPASPGTSASPAPVPPAPVSSASTSTESDKDGDGRGFEYQKKSDRTPVTSNIVGTFTGWTGKTVFKLENGMIWEQNEKDQFSVRAIEGPEVTIKPGIFGTWRLQVKGYGPSVKVRRLQ